MEKEWLKLIDEILEEKIFKDLPYVNEVYSYTVLKKGKRIRPLLVIYSATLVGGKITPLLLEVSAGIEIIHTTSLLHDDVIDEGKMRRGEASVPICWNNQISITVGDYILAVTYLELLRKLPRYLIEPLFEAVVNMCSGELLEINQQASNCFSIKRYFEIVEAKTASLMKASCNVGALIGGGTPGEVNALACVGKYFGMAYQIYDDLLDYIGDPEEEKKTLWQDFPRGILTLPIIYAFSKASPKEREWIKTLLLETEEVDRKKILEFINYYDGFTMCLNLIETYLDRCYCLLSGFGGKENDFKNFLKSCINLSKLDYARVKIFPKFFIKHYTEI